LVVGQDIIEPFNPESGGIALSEIARVRGELLEDDDLRLPLVRVMDDTSLPPREYAIYFWGELVYQGSILGHAARELPADQLPSSADVTDEPGYLGRVEWIRGKRKRGTPTGPPLIVPAMVAVANLKQLARRHRDLVTADRPPAVSYPVVEAMSLEELLEGLPVQNLIQGPARHSRE
jgi:flagellar biosynthesis component FlhA